ncbi:MAG: PfkB family carbohydrate kinase [Rhodospirillales bacterium]|nr:PfkB family carbohydrate kinase [Rhodospirillales bacterium]
MGGPGLPQLAIRLLGLGDNTIDTYVDLALQFPRGNAVNVAVFASRLGAEAGYLGCLGDDEGGDLLAAALAAEGVDLRLCRRRAGANARAMIGLEGGERRFLAANSGVRAEYMFTQADLASVVTYDVVHTGINSEAEDVLPVIRQHAVLLSYDCSEGPFSPRATAALPLADIAFFSAPHAPPATCTALLEQIAAAGPPIVVATRGAAGAMALAEGQVFDEPAVPIRPVDTLGAGDAFIAAFLIAHLSRRPIGEALAAGTRLAADVCRAHGAFGHGAPWHGAAATILARTEQHP